MRVVLILIVSAHALCTAYASRQATSDFSRLTGPYLGQKSPSTAPEVFAPGTVSTEGTHFGYGRASHTHGLGNEFTPFLIPDDADLSFASGRTGDDNVYWVDAGSVEKIVVDEKPTSEKRVFEPHTQLLIMGGFNESVIYSDVHSVSVLDLLSGEEIVWIQQPSLPKALQGHAAAVSNGHIYIIGGVEGFAENRRAVFSSDVFSAETEDSGLTEWKRNRSIPCPLSYHAVAKYRDFIIISGGQTPHDNSAVYRTRIAENGEMDVWERAGDLPKPVRGHASVMVRDRLFILGGHNDRGFFADVLSAPVDMDGKIGEWEYTTPLPVPLVHFGAAEHQGRIFVFGGQDAEDNLHSEVYSAEAVGSKLGPWRKEAPFPVPQSRMTVNVVDGKIFVTGGGFGWAPPVYSAIYSSEIGEDGVLGEWRKIGDLPKQLAFHAAVVCP